VRTFCSEASIGLQAVGADSREAAAGGVGMRADAARLVSSGTLVKLGGGKFRILFFNVCQRKMSKLCCVLQAL